MKTGVKIFALLYGLLCVTSAVLQYNDPDPMMWIIVYAVSALLSFGFALNRVPSVFLLVAGILALCGGFYFFPEQFEGFEIGKGDIKNIEEGRESVGLFIIGVVLLFFGLYKRYLKKLEV